MVTLPAASYVAVLSRFIAASNEWIPGCGRESGFRSNGAVAVAVTTERARPTAGADRRESTATN